MRSRSWTDEEGRKSRKGPKDGEEFSVASEFSRQETVRAHRTSEIDRDAALPHETVSAAHGARLGLAPGSWVPEAGDEAGADYQC